jgi:uncharacterized membrane protein
MRGVRGQRLVRFALFTVTYAGAAALVLLFMAIGICSMQPDVAATCDTTPIDLIFLGLAVIYLACAFVFFRRKASGVD